MCSGSSTSGEGDVGIRENIYNYIMYIGTRQRRHIWNGQKEKGLIYIYIKNKTTYYFKVYWKNSLDTRFLRVRIAKRQTLYRFRGDVV